ncbi:MAG: hypothetical protein ACYDBB_25645 [Armatimonadota bacterium]
MNATYLLPLLSLLCWCALAIAAPTQTIHLKEYLGHTWSDELISYPLDAGLRNARHLEVRDETGTLLPYQVSNGRVYLLVTLPADGEKVFTVTAGMLDAAAKTAASTKTEDGLLTLDNGVMALRMPAGSKNYAQPMDADKVPGPLAGVRGASGGWIGKSWFQAPLKVTGYATTLTAGGPLFAEAMVSYTFEGGKHYRFSARVIAGQPTAIIDESMDLNPGGKYRIPKYKDDTDASTWEWWNLDDAGAMFLSTSPNGHPANVFFSFYDGLAPDQCRWRGAQASQPYKGVTAEGKAWNMWAQGEIEAYAPLTYAKDEQFNRIAGWWVNSLADYSYYFTILNEQRPDAPAISFSTGRPSRNVNPNFDLPNDPWIKVVTGVNDLRIMTSTKKDLQAMGAICLGSREWLLTIQPQATLTPKGAMVKPTAYQAVRKYSFFPLEKIKEWTFDWPEPKNAWPRMFCKPGDLAEMRTRLQSAPAEMQKYWMMPAAYFKNATPQDVTKQAMTYIKDEVDGALTDKVVNSFGWFPRMPMTRSATMWEGAMAMPGLDPKDRARIKAYGAFLAHRSWDDDFWPPKANCNGWGSINMATLASMSRVFTASIMVGHPSYSKWQQRSKGYLLGNLLPLLGSDGASISSPSYSMASIEPVVDMALALKFGGAYDAFKDDPRLQKLGQFMIDVLTPPDIRTPIGGDPKNGFRTNLWTVGDTQRSLTTGMHDMLALGYAGTNEKLAGALRTMSKRQENPAGSGFVPTALLVNRTTPLAEPDLRSRWYPNYAVFMRDNRPRETWFALRETQFAIDHFHADQGAFTLFAKGVPLMMDWGSMYMPYMPQAVYHNRILWDLQEGELRPCPGFGTDGCFYKGQQFFAHTVEPWTVKAEMFGKGMSPQDALGNMQRVAFLPAADYLQGRLDVRYLQTQAYFHDKPDSGNVNQTPVVEEMKQPFSWERRVLYAKAQADGDPTYFLIRDDFQGNSPKPTAAFWIMANDLTFQGNQAHATGQFGVDLEIYAAQPAQPQFGKWQFEHKGYGGEKQLCLRISQPEGKPFLTLLYPRKADEPMPVFATLANGDGVKITAGKLTDYAFLSPTPVNFTEGNVRFAGTAGYIRINEAGALAALSAAGKVSMHNLTLTAEGPMCLQLVAKRAVLHVDGPAQTLKLSGKLPGSKVKIDGKTVRAAVRNSVLAIAVPAGKHEVVVE